MCSPSTALKSQELVSSWPQAQEARAGALPLAVIALERGFEADDLAIVGEQDILGDRLVRIPKRKRRAQDVLAEAAALSAGDLVVHIDHGVGRFVGLKTIEAAGAPHDCLEIHYAGGDRLFLPVENLELLSRYGSEQGELDRLGASGWQTRKSRLKKRVREMAGELIRIAAQRMTRSAPRLIPPDGLYDEFCARFPYDETQDQAAAIEATLDDLAAGRPMDRLVCGDVGFGKTEVALRAAFSAAINGKQTAIVAPTTLLARQHAKTFAARFVGLPVRIGLLSRMVGAAEQRETKKGLAEGTIDIAIGTHALLGKTVAFKELGLVVIDEEQHFGVGHKERLKELRAEVHVLTLSATPIPRTLQLAMSGVRELSIIATPPIDRLAVRSFVSPFDALIVREALLRERYRGGQSFYVCPRIDDLDEAAAFLRQNVPEAKFVVAHGQMAASELEDKIGAFYDGKYDILLSTSIVESGLDIPRANTLIVHRADMFGLAQLYQLRGRVGRAKARAYAIFTTPAKKPITPQAEKRLAVLQSLDTLGRRLPARQPRPRPARGRQSARRGAVGPHQGGRLRALPADGAGGDRAAEERRGRAGAGPVVAVDLARRAGDDPRKLHSRPDDPPRALSPPVGAGGGRGDRGDGRRDRRPLRPAAARSRAADQAGVDQGPVPARPCREARSGGQGPDARLPRQFLRRSGRAGEMGLGAGAERARPPRHAHRRFRRIRRIARPPRRRAEDHARDRQDRDEEGVGGGPSPLARAPAMAKRGPRGLARPPVGVDWPRQPNAASRHEDRRHFRARPGARSLTSAVAAPRHHPRRRAALAHARRRSDAAPVRRQAGDGADDPDRDRRRQGRRRRPARSPSSARARRRTARSPSASIGSRANSTTRSP